MSSESSVSHINPLHVDDVHITPLVEKGRVSCAFKGKITARQPDASIAPFLREVHESAVRAGVKRVDIDVTELSFVNSSGIRLFVDWTMWAKGDGAPAYTMVFRTRDSVTWQRMTLAALTSLAPEVVQIVAES